MFPTLDLTVLLYLPFLELVVDLLAKSYLEYPSSSSISASRASWIVSLKISFKASSISLIDLKFPSLTKSLTSSFGNLARTPPPLIT